MPLSASRTDVVRAYFQIDKAFSNRFAYLRNKELLSRSMHRLTHLNALRAFEATARHLSYVRAAEELGVTPAAVGQHVRALEAWLGIALFRRIPGPPVRLVVSEDAQAALPDIRAGFDRLAVGLRRLKHTRAEAVITVTASPSFSAKWLLPRLYRFTERHPHLDVRLDATDRLFDLCGGDADFGIRYGGGHWPGLRSHRLLGEEVFPVCSPSLIQGAFALKTPGDLRNHTLIHDATIRFDADFPTWRAWLALAGERNVDAERGLVINASAAVAQAALDGRGVALGRSVVVGDDVAAGRLVRLFPEIQCPVNWAYYAVYRPGAEKVEKIAHFLDWMMTESEQRDGSEPARAATSPA
jgi:LysR family transcriptional regulator, glycine cleavage system transcriptional activator